MKKLLILLSILLLQTISYAQESLINNDIEGRILETSNINEPIIQKELDKLEKNYDLQLVFGYRATTQKDTVSAENATGDSIDLVALYTPNENFSAGLQLEIQHKYGENSSSLFYKSIGSLNKLSPAFSDLNLYVKEIWGNYRKDNIGFRAGILNPNAFIDRSYYNNFNKFFMSHAFSSQSYGNIPISSLGVGLKYKTTNYFLNAIACDGTDKIGEAIDNIKEDKLTLYTSVSAGYKPEKDVYFVNIWTKESKTSQKDSYGAYLSLNHHVNDYNKVYAKYGVIANSDTRQHISFGWSHSNLFDDSDLLLTAFASTQASSDKKFQNTIEILYQYVFGYGIELSADLQIIQNPIVLEHDWAVIPGVRFRVLF